jgi:hypothetical protein
LAREFTVTSRKVHRLKGFLIILYTVNHPSQSEACFPPGFKFMCDVRSASSEYAK